MLIYLYGPDAYRRQQKLKEELKKFADKHSDLSVQRFDLAEKDDLDKLKDFSTSQSLFDSSKFGIIYGVADREPKEIDYILKLADGSKVLHMAVIADKSLPKIFKSLHSESVKSFDFVLLDPVQQMSFIKKEIADRGAKISDKDLAVLLGNFPGDTWSIISEIEKITLGGKVEAVAGETGFFPAIQAIEHGGTIGKKLSALERLLAQDEPAKIFNILASMSRDKNKMASYDVAIKSGKLEYEEALLYLVLGS